MSITTKEKARKIYEKMMETDRFTAWLGLVLEDIDDGKCRMHYEITSDMINGFKSTHGGILFAASDSVFAFACNSHGLIAVALEASIHYYKPVYEGEKLVVTAEKVFLGRRTGVYDVKTINEKGAIVCQFKGTAYRTKKEALSGQDNTKIN